MEVKIINNQIILGRNSDIFFRQNNGKRGVLEINDRESEHLRRYFEGAVVRTYFYLHPHSGWASFLEARENLKLEFNGMTIRDREGKERVIGKSTMMSKEKWQNFMDKIHSWFIENGYGEWWPDFESYKKWELDANPDDIYPPILALKKMYESKKLEGVPAWRR